jgi:hypothetical protein
MTQHLLAQMYNRLQHYFYVPSDVSVQCIRKKIIIYGLLM